MKTHLEALSIGTPEDLQDIGVGEIASSIKSISAVLEIEENGKIVSIRGLVSKDGFIVYDNKGKTTVYPPKTRVCGIIAMFN